MPKKGKKHTEEAKRKMSKSKLGKNNPMYGKIGNKHHFYGKNHTLETKRKISSANRGHMPWNKGTKGIMKAWNKGLTKETEKKLVKQGRRHSKTMKRLFKEGKLISPIKGKKISEEQIKKRLETIKKRYGKLIAWNKGLTKENDLRVLKNTSRGSKKTQFKKGHKPSTKAIINSKKALGLKPNKPEKLMMRLIQENNLPFNYTGNGAIWFRGENHIFNPDFLSKNPKYIIEVFGDYWHNLAKAKTKDKERLETYAKYGYKTLVIWEHELRNPFQVVNKLKEFILNKYL